PDERHVYGDLSVPAAPHVLEALDRGAAHPLLPGVRERPLPRSDGRQSRDVRWSGSQGVTTHRRGSTARPRRVGLGRSRDLYAADRRPDGDGGPRGARGPRSATIPDRRRRGGRAARADPGARPYATRRMESRAATGGVGGERVRDVSGRVRPERAGAPRDEAVAREQGNPPAGSNRGSHRLAQGPVEGRCAFYRVAPELSRPVCSPRRQVLLLPRDAEYAVAARTAHVGGVPGDGCARAAGGTDRVPGVPAGGRRLGVRLAGTRHDGPVARPIAERFDVAAWHPHLFTVRHLKDGFIRLESNASVPRASSQPATLVGIEARRLTRERFARLGHVAQGERRTGDCQSAIPLSRA